jgi:hypothetical protein
VTGGSQLHCRSRPCRVAAQQQSHERSSVRTVKVAAQTVLRESAVNWACITNCFWTFSRQQMCGQCGHCSDTPAHCTASSTLVAVASKSSLHLPEVVCRRQQ